MAIHALVIIRVFILFICLTFVQNRFQIHCVRALSVSTRRISCCFSSTRIKNKQRENGWKQLNRLHSSSSSSLAFQSSYLDNLNNDDNNENGDEVKDKEDVDIGNKEYENPNSSGFNNGLTNDIDGNRNGLSKDGSFSDFDSSRNGDPMMDNVNGTNWMKPSNQTDIISLPKPIDAIKDESVRYTPRPPNILRDDMNSIPRSLAPVQNENVTSDAQYTISTDIDINDEKYQDALEVLKDTKNVIINGIDQSTYERQIAAEKIRRERELKEDEYWSEEKIGDLIDSVSSFMSAYIKDEYKRQLANYDLITALLSSVETRTQKLVSEEKITTELQKVLSKLSSGKISSQISSLLAKKEKAILVEEELILTLKECVRELEIILNASRERQGRMEDAIALRKEPFQMSDLEALESLLANDFENVLETEDKISSLISRIEDVLLDERSLIFEDQSKETNRKPSQGDRNVRSTSSSSSNDIIISYNAMNKKEEREVLDILGDSLIDGVLEGSKLVVFGLKAVVETLASEEVGAAASSTIDLSESVLRKDRLGGGSASLVRNNAYTTLESSNLASRAITDSITSTGQVFVSTIDKYESTQIASIAARKLWGKMNTVFNASLNLAIRNLYKLGMDEESRQLALEEDERKQQQLKGDDERKEKPLLKLPWQMNRFW